MKRILVVEDHESLCHSLKSGLENEGFAVDVATTLEEARAKVSSEPDLIVLDWMLPDGQGVDLLKALRAAKSLVPVIFLTARADVIDKVLGLELGASDYVTKPFEMRELIARIRVRLRELPSGSPAESVDSLLQVGQLSIDRLKHRVTFGDKSVDLVKKEFDLLMLFAESPEKVFSRDEILNKVWGYDVFPTTRTVDTHVLFLRQKLHGDLIETVRSVGYRLRPL